MRTITNALLTAQTAASGRPHVRVEALDMLAGVARPNATRRYTGAEESFHHAATSPADASLVRVRMTSTDGALWVQRTANPGPASDFSPWTRLDTAATACNVAVCSHGANVLVFFRDPSNARVVRVRESADSGRTWAARRAAATLASGAVDWLATSFSSAGAPALFLAASDARLHVTTRTGATWSALEAHDYALVDITGLACDYDTAWRLAVTGSDATGRHRLWSASYDGAWSPLLEITRADAGSGVTFDAPFLRLADVGRLTVVERYTGAGGYRRPLTFTALADTPYDANSWADPVPFPADAPYGVAVAGTVDAMTGDDDALWLSTPDAVWHAALDASPRDLSADVLWLTMRESPSGSTVTLALRNDDARYNDVGDPTAPVREGTELRVSPGYTTASGVEVSEGPTFWVTGWERRYGGGEATLVVHAADGWALLAGWRARRQFAWARGEAAMASILGFILQRVGLGLQSANPSAPMLSHRPSFTVHPGETGATAVRASWPRTSSTSAAARPSSACRSPPTPSATPSAAITPSTTCASPQAPRTPRASRSSARPELARPSPGAKCPWSASASARSTTSTRTPWPRPKPTPPRSSTASSATPSPASSKPRPTAPKSSTTSSTSTPRTPPPPRECA